MVSSLFSAAGRCLRATTDPATAAIKRKASEDAASSKSKKARTESPVLNGSSKHAEVRSSSIHCHSWILLRPPRVLSWASSPRTIIFSRYPSVLDQLPKRLKNNRGSLVSLRSSLARPSCILKRPVRDSSRLTACSPALLPPILLSLPHLSLSTSRRKLP